MGEFLSKITDYVQGAPPPDISGQAFISHPIISKLAFYGKIGFYMAVAFFLFIFIYKFTIEYKVRITVWRAIGGGGLESKKDAGRVIIDEQGKRKLQLLWMRDGKRPLTLPIPESIYKSKVGKRDKYDLWIDDNFQLHPILPPSIREEDMKHLRVRPQERDAWALYERKRLLEKYKTKDAWEKYMPTAVVLASFMIAFLIIFFVSKDLANGMHILAGQFGQVASSCTSFG